MAAPESAWSLRARAAVREALAALPPSASLEDRRRAVAAAYPFGRRANHPYKVWLRVVKQELPMPSRPEAEAPPSVRVVCVREEWWIDVVCDWCTGGGRAGCLCCGPARDRLATLTAMPEWPEWHRALRAGAVPAGVVADWCEDHGHADVAAAVRAAGVARGGVTP